MKAQHILKDVKAMLPLLRSQAREADALGNLTPKAVEALAAAGVFKIGMPEQLGGYALGPTEQFEILAEIARADGSAAWVAWVDASSFTNFALAFPARTVEEIARANWAGPLVAGSVFSGHAKGVARRCDEGWLVSGRWAFCSNVQLAAWTVGGVQYEDDQGNKTRGVALLARGQYQIADDWHVMGMSASNSNTAHVDEEVFVPAHRLISVEGLMKSIGDPTPRFEGRLSKIDKLVSLNVTNSAIALGMARGAFECFLEQAKKRPPFGLPYETLAKTPSIQVVAGKVEAMIAAAEALLMSALREVERRADADEVFTHEDRLKSNMTSSYAALLCGEAIDLLQLSLGSSTASLSNPIQRFMRDVRVLSLHGLHRLDFSAENRGRVLFGEPPHPMAFQ